MAVAAVNAAKDMIITVPEGGGICRVDQPTPSGGREIYLCAPQTIGRLLANLDEKEGVVGQKWFDLLGATTPGIAVGWRAKDTFLLLSFPARVKTVKATLSDTSEVAVPYNLPPTTWMVRFNAEDVLTSSFLWVSPTSPRSVQDTLQVAPSPWGNVHPSGAVCWGNVSTRPLKPTDPIAIDNLFWGTGFNNHLVYPERNFILPEEGGRIMARSHDDWVKWQVAHPTTPLVPRYAGAVAFNSKVGQFLSGTLRGE